MNGCLYCLDDNIYYHLANMHPLGYDYSYILSLAINCLTSTGNRLSSYMFIGTTTDICTDIIQLRIGFGKYNS